MNDHDKRIQEILQGNFEKHTPSLDFTEKTMRKITEQKEGSVKQKEVYSPVISKVGWFFIAFFTLGMIYFGLVGKGGSPTRFPDFTPNWDIDFSMVQSQIVLISVVVTFSLLMLDRLIMKIKVG